MSVLTKNKVLQAKAAYSAKLTQQLPKSHQAINHFKYNSKFQSTRAKQLFLLVIASASAKAKFAIHFFSDFEKRLALTLESIKLNPKQFGFKSQKKFSEYLKSKIINMRTRAKDFKEFQGGMDGRKWWFIGTILFERYIKYGPFRKFLDLTAKDALKVINKEITTGKPYKMQDAWGNSHSITDKFDNLSAGLEFILETVDGEKAYLDFGHIAFNNKGQWMIPTPTEIKLPWAYGGVRKQFRSFVPRLTVANKLIVIFEESELSKIDKQIGKAIIGWAPVDGMIHAELDPKKLVFDPLAKNQIIVKPGKLEWGDSEWGTVKPINKDPEVDIDIGTADKKGASDRFFFWKFELDVHRSVFEAIYQKLFF